MENLKGIIHDIANKLTISKSINRNLANLLGKDHKEVKRLQTSIEESIHLLEELKRKSNNIKRRLPLENIQRIKESEAMKVESLASLYDIELIYRNNISKNIWVNLNSYSSDRILCNCIENAKNAGATKVVIEYSLKRNHLQLTIKDNGSGMNSEALERVGFGYTSQDGEGHGIGTQVIRSMVQELGGSVEWSSIEDLGTCCLLKYKIEHDSEIIQEREETIITNMKLSQSNSIISGKKILVVSKSPMELGIWKDYISSIGAKAITCEHGDVALNHIYKFSPHCILVGKEFKDMSSKRWLELINTDRVNLNIPKVLYITESDDIEELNQFKVDDIINYSAFDNDKIRVKLEHVISQKEVLKNKKKQLVREGEFSSIYTP
jgi:hypothetical protein